MLAIAVATGRVGYVFLSGTELMDWRMSKKASHSRKNAIRQVEQWIDRTRPDVVVTEDVSKRSRKGARSKRLIASIADVAFNRPLLDVTVERVPGSQNKYEEAKALAAQFPQILPWLPKQPRIWEAEPRSTVYFEALGMALKVIDPDQAKA